MKWTITKISLAISLLLAVGASVFAVSTASATTPVTNVTSILPITDDATLAAGQWAYTEQDGSALGQLSSTVNDPINNDGSLELYTTSSNTDHVIVQTPLTGNPSSLSGVSYQTFLGSTPNTPSTVASSANASIQLSVVCDASDASAATHGYTTLVFEPYENPSMNTQVTGAWQTWGPDLTTSGTWWSSHYFSGSTATGLTSSNSGAELGGQSDTESYSTLMTDLDASCTDPSIEAIGFGLGSYNPSITTWVDNLNYAEASASENWNFSAPVAPGSAAATNVSSIVSLANESTLATGLWGYTEQDGSALGQLSSTVNDPTNHDGSLELSTTSSSADHVIVQTPLTGNPSTLSGLSYQTFLGTTPSALAGSANASIQLSVICDATDTTSPPTHGYTTLVFEPYENTTPQVTGAWQTWGPDLTTTGTWWSSHYFSGSTTTGLTKANSGGELGGQSDTESYSTLMTDLDASCTDPSIQAIGFGLGSANPSVTTWVDNLTYTQGTTTTAWNFMGPNTVPGPPTGVVATPSNGQASVSFVAPTDIGSSAITSYTVTATDLTTPANGRQTASGTPSPITVIGLTDGDSYSFTITATNGSGTSLPGGPSNTVVPEPPAVTPPITPPVSPPVGPPTPPVTPPSTSPATGGAYDLVGSDGGVFVFGQPGTGFYGSLPGIHIHVNNIVGIVPTNDGKGYFLVGSDGGVFAFGDAGFYGSLPKLNIHVNDIVGIVPTTDDKGYFLVGRDGGVFAFGDAPFENSLPGEGTQVNNIVGIAATPDNGGYWLVGATGQVYNLGDAKNFGSAASGPVVAIASTHDGGGYWLTTANGTVDVFGDAGNYKDLPAINVVVSNIVSLVPSADGQGYLLIGSDGGTFAFGDANFPGSLPGLGIHVNNIVGAVPVA